MKKNRNFFTFSLLSLIAVLSWTGFEVYRAVTKAAPPTVTEAQLAALDPNLPEEVLDNLEGRRIYSDQELEGLAGSVVIVTPVASPSATPTEVLLQ